MEVRVRFVALLLLLTVPTASPAAERFTSFDSFLSQYREAPAEARGDEGYIHQNTQLMDTYFKSTGLKPKTVYTHQGHSFGAWRFVTADMLKHFFRAKRD